jgi:hypothetical protein
LAFYRQSLAGSGWRLAEEIDRYTITYPVEGVDTHLFCRDEPPSWLWVSVVREARGDTLIRLDFGASVSERCGARRSIPCLPIVRLVDVTDVSVNGSDYPGGKDYSFQTTRTPAEIMEIIDRAFTAAGCLKTSEIEGMTTSMMTWETEYRKRPVTVECTIFRIPGVTDRMGLSMRYYKPDGGQFIVL